MAKRPQKTRKSQTSSQELVIVTFAKNLEQAKDYEALLKANDIPAMIRHGHESEHAEDKGIAVMVPEDSLDEAHVVIESQDAYDDFYDLALEEDEGDSDLDSELFDDDF